MKKLFIFLLVVGWGSSARAQQPPFYNEIESFKKGDSAAFPPKGAILFVGSSSFTKWTDVQDYFPGYTIINRGFGGSSLPDVLRYASTIIFPYQPKQVVIYCGENDLAASDTVSAQTVVNRFKQLFGLIRKRLPTTEIDFISLKPSPSRRHLMPKMVVVNNQVKKFLKARPHTAFIDVYHKMFTPEKRPIPEIFISDSLHMNAKGYAIWQKTIRPYLLK